MGFYPPASLVRDAQRRGVEVRAPDVNLSGARCGLEPRDDSLSRHAVRVGLAYVSSVGTDDAEALEAEREANGPYRDVGDLARRATVSRDALEALVRGRRLRLPRAPPPRPPLGARASRRGRARWRGRAARRSSSRSRSTRPRRRRTCPTSPAGSGCSPTTGRRGSRSARTRCRCSGRTCPEGTLSSPELHEERHGAAVAYAGLAIARQRPATANGIVFMLLEDEHGQVNLIVPKDVYERHRAIVRGEPLLLARGRYERVERNRNVLVARAREPLAARPPRRRDTGRRRRAPARAPLRAPLSSAAGGEAAVPARQREDGVDEREVRERLREVADLPLGRDVVLLGEQARGRCGARAAARRAPRPPSRRPWSASHLDEPERAGQERPLAGREAVDVRVLVVRAVARDEARPS